jgi:PEP-CTERM motif
MACWAGPIGKFRCRLTLRVIRSLVTVASCAALAAILPLPARAMVVATLPGTDSKPTGIDANNLTKDPGWNNVSQGGPNYIYLGNGWVLSARHVGVSTATFWTGSSLSSYDPIPNQNFVLTNPVSSGLTDSQGTFTTDLRLIRINGEPSLPSIFGANPAFTIATQEPTLNSEVTFIGQGPTRAANPSTWDASWNPGGSPAQFNGYDTLGDYTKRWGKNFLASNQGLGGTGGGVSQPISLWTGDGITRQIVSLSTEFKLDQTANTYEAQAVSGDSGSSVFRVNPTTNKWELIGIVNAAFRFSNQPSTIAVYTNPPNASGDLTSFADLSYYHDQIFNIINAHTNYSILGDLNLDGIVSGDGNGPAVTDDVSAFISGWGSSQATGNITSWKKGDLNLDGKVDASDFLLLRTAFNSAGSGASLNSLTTLLGGGNGGVPEPSSVILATIGGALLALFCRRRNALSAR